MKLALQLVGTGTQADPYRADFPTYDTLDVDVDNRIIYVDVPDYIAPNVEPAPPPIDGTVIADDVVLTVASDAVKREWHRTLDALYGAEKRAFRPEFPSK